LKFKNAQNTTGFQVVQIEQVQKSESISDTMPNLRLQSTVYSLQYYIGKLEAEDFYLRYTRTHLSFMYEIYAFAMENLKFNISKKFLV